MILLFTDFSPFGPYVGQMRSVLAAAAPSIPVVDLMHDAPPAQPKPAAYLLAALLPFTPAGATIVAVVDPGVGTARQPLMLRLDGRWLVGPDNGLFAIAHRRATTAEAWRIDWRPPSLSASFHGRDLFAPVAAELAQGRMPAASPIAPAPVDWPDDLAEIVYVDGFGNALTGLRADRVSGLADLPRARSFAEVAPGAAFWYENSLGLVEIAINCGRADTVLGLRIGAAVRPAS